MSATFTIKVNRVFTKNEGDLQNVVKKVEWTLSGEQDGQKFDLPQTSDVDSPTPESFVQYDSLTEANVIAWIESKPEMLAPIKAHIQMVLDKESAKAALSTPDMPWAPPSAPMPAPPAPPTAEPAPAPSNP